MLSKYHKTIVQSILRLQMEENNSHTWREKGTHVKKTVTNNLQEGRDKQKANYTSQKKKKCMLYEFTKGLFEKLDVNVWIGFSWLRRGSIG